ncbi:hypothetical protein BH24DEI2_BH24DEI2_02270 [soil metagenome]
MKYKATLSSKGQITLPLEIRKRLGLKKGDMVEFVNDGERTLVMPSRTEENPFERWAGAFPVFESKQEVIDWVREMRDEE